jgi:DNA repair protein RadA/Sms
MEEVAAVPDKGKPQAAMRTANVQRMVDIDLSASPHVPIGIAELDRVLGGGLIEGAVVLVGGEPGVGKSTLLLQAAEMVAKTGRAALYVSGEESARQVRMRAGRIGANSENLFMLCETDIDSVIEAMNKYTAPLVVIDSIQTMQKSELSTSMGSVSQVRECAATALRAAKQTGATVILVGHVTKEGNIAGPRVLEHMVDTVLYFEGERHNSFRILRAVKNRFGSTNEIGIFDMTETGMREVNNPSDVLVSRNTLGVPGAAVTCALEGTRPMLCEVQALCAASPYGQPRRTATGVDYNRLLLLIAVMERSGGIVLYNRDVYANAVGGLRLSEPGSDAALLAALASAATGRPIRDGVAITGEIGLTGEIRRVASVERRASECVKMGFSTLVIPKDNLKGVKPPAGLRFYPVERVTDLLSFVLVPVAAGQPDEQSSFNPI